MELRNLLVHNVSRVAFKFESYLEELDRNQKSALQKALGGSNLEVLKFKFWLQGMRVLATLYLKKEIADRTHEERALAIQATKLLKQVRHVLVHAAAHGVPSVSAVKIEAQRPDDPPND